MRMLYNRTDNRLTKVFCTAFSIFHFNRIHSPITLLSYFCPFASMNVIFKCFHLRHTYYTARRSGHKTESTRRRRSIDVSTAQSTWSSGVFFSSSSSLLSSGHLHIHHMHQWHMNRANMQCQMK